MKKFFLAIFVLIISAFSTTGFSRCCASALNQEATLHTDFRSAKDMAKDMYPGWNLGNTLEATGGETAWQSTKTTQEIIDYVKSLGFRSIRIPCSWNVHTVNGKIDPKWMKRVNEVIDYCINADLYVILNDHWDEGWIEVNGFSSQPNEFVPVSQEQANEKAQQLKAIWTEIANRFKDYDERLMFAGLNEPFQESSLFPGHHAELTPLLEFYNAAFVEAVRATGGNNLRRNLIVQGPAADINSTIQHFSIPAEEGREQGHIFIEVHFYDPWQFTCGMDYYYWGSELSWMLTDVHYADYCFDESYVTQQFSKLYNKFVKRDIPVIIGEYSANWRDLSEEGNEAQTLHNLAISSYYWAVNKYAVYNGLVCFAWDINVTDRHGISGISTIIDRANLKIFNPIAYDAIMNGTKEGIWPY